MRAADLCHSDEKDAREVKAFLDRHGFVDMHSERSSSGYKKVRMEPLLASDLAYMLHAPWSEDRQTTPDT